MAPALFALTDEQQATQETARRFAADRLAPGYQQRDRDGTLDRAARPGGFATIDGAEWAIPSHDILMGFQNVTKYYYMPDMRQPPGIQEFLINKTKWDELPADLQAIVKNALLGEIMRMNNASIDLESKAVHELAHKHGVKLMRTPDDILKAQLPAMDKVYEEESRKNPFFSKVLASQREFAQRVVPHAARKRPPLERAVEHCWSK